jgi:hypothetical protein
MFTGSRENLQEIHWFSIWKKWFHVVPVDFPFNQSIDIIIMYTYISYMYVYMYIDT